MRKTRHFLRGHFLTEENLSANWCGSFSGDVSFLKYKPSDTDDLTQGKDSRQPEVKGH